MSEIGEWDWWTTVNGNLLHAAEVDAGSFDTCGYGRTACGRHWWLMIPGMFARMGASRCPRCCVLYGYPKGKGSPKNDDGCRPLVEARLSKANA